MKHDNPISSGERQTTSHLMMIRPVKFAFNTQTSGNNAFQSVQDSDAQALALKEFDDFVALLRDSGIDVTVINDSPLPHTPDSIFPNNWISFHQDGRIVLYPMFAENRRQERKAGVLDTIRNKFILRETLDLTHFEKQDRFLEGTGSMVLDRPGKIAYACLSKRTDAGVLNDFCAGTGFSAVAFTATDEKGFPIYHTNVMMCVADDYAIICLDSIPDPAERQTVCDTLTASGKDVLTISLEQMNHFAGNMLQVQNNNAEKFLIMSSQAFRALTAGQLERIEHYNSILHSSLDTIERNGGGSARCMMAEVFLPVKN